MTGREELPPAVGPLDHEVGRALVPLAPDHPDKPPGERVVRRRDPHTFDVAGMTLISVLAVVR